MSIDVGSSIRWDRWETLRHYLLNVLTAVVPNKLIAVSAIHMETGLCKSINVVKLDTRTLYAGRADGTD